MGEEGERTMHDDAGLHIIECFGYGVCVAEVDG